MATDEETRKKINALLQYPEDSAGSIMNIEMCIRDRCGWNSFRRCGSAVSSGRRRVESKSDQISELLL